MKPYVVKSVSKKLATEIIPLYREKYPKRKIIYQNGMFYISKKSGENISVLDYRSVKCIIEGRGIHIEPVIKERVKKKRKTNAKKT